LKVWDLDSNQAIQAVGGPDGAVIEVMLSANGKRAVSRSRDDILKLWDVESGKAIRTLGEDNEKLYKATLIMDGQRVIAESPAGTYKIWDLESGDAMPARARNLDHGGELLAFSADGRHAVSRGEDDRIAKLWDLESGEVIRTLKGHADPVGIESLSADGKRAVSMSGSLNWEMTLMVWDLESGEVIATLAGHVSEFSVCAFSADGRRAVNGALYNSVNVWDLSCGKVIRELKGHTDRVSALAVSVDGRLAISGSEDHTLRVWDLESGGQLAMFCADDTISSCSIAADGVSLCAGDEAGRVHFLRFMGR
jgi:WD40 repeat protein